MRSQIEKNKEILCDEMEKLGNEKMTEAVAAKLSAYHGAFEALCMADEKPVRVPGEPAQKRSGMTRHSGAAAYRQTPKQFDAHSLEESEGYMLLTRAMAVEWTRDMENSDGTHGPHWNMEQVKQVMEQREIDCDPVMFFAVLNAVYSDYYAVAKKHGVNKMDFYADLAKAWLEDEDAVEDKAGKYFQYIVKH